MANYSQSEIGESPASPDDAEDDSQPTTVRESKGQIVFDDLTSAWFENLVEQTLEESEFIEVENGIIYEVTSNE